MWAAFGLPLLFVAATMQAQTAGLVSPMSGDCTTSSTGVVTCTKTNGVSLANSATTDTTNAGNITSGVLPMAQVPSLTGAKLPAGAAGTVPSYNAAGVQAPALQQPYVATAGPIKVAPFNVSAPTSAGTLIGPFSTTGYRVANITNGARLLTTGQVSQIKTYIANTTGATALYFELWRVNNSGTFNLVCRSQNLLTSVTGNALNTFAITGCNAQAGDYPAMYVQGSFSGQVTVFSASTAYPQASYPTYYANGALLSSTEDFLGGSTGVAYAPYYNVPIEVYLAKGPVLVGLGDSKMQGIPFSGDFLQAAYNGSYQFPVAPQANYSTATLGTSLIDLSNQPVAWVSRVLGYTYANLGITGSTSTVQLQQALPTALALKPAVLILSGTINDAGFSVPTSTSLSNYQSMYTQAVAAGVQKVVMTGVEPAGAITEAVWSNSTYGADALNAALKSYCQAQTQCVWVGDAVMAALGQYRSGGAAGSMHNIQPGFAAADNLHFNNAGAQAMGVLEANAVEAPSTVGMAVAVANPFGTASRSRAVVAISHDGTLGWRWQDTRDFLQVDTQGLDGAGVSGGAGVPGQQTLGCVMFAAGKGYVRCDGAFTWGQQAGTLTVPTVTAATANLTTVNATTVNATAVNSSALTMTGLFSQTLPDNGASNPYPLTVLKPNMATGTSMYFIYGKAASTGNSVAFGYQYATQPYGSLETFGGAAPVQMLGSQVWLNGGNVYVGNSNAKGSVAGGATGGGLFNVGTANQFQVAANGAASLPHLVGNSAVPAVAAGAAAASCTVSGTDMGFLLTCTTGSSPAAGTLATVTFAGAYGAAPHFAGPAAVNAASAAASGGLFAASTATTLTVSTANALTASTSYAWHFVLVQ